MASTVPETKCEADFPDVLRGKTVLLATESLGPINGVSKTTGNLIEYLKAHGVNVVVVAPEISPSSIKTSQFVSVDVRLSGWPLPYNPDLTIAYPFRIDRIFRNTAAPDLVYLASPASVGFQVLLQVRQLYDPLPLLCNFQTDLSSYSEIIFPKWMDRYAIWLLGVVQGYLFNGPSVCTVFYPCADIRRYLEGAGVRRDKLVHLGRGVNTALFNPSRRDETYRKEIAPNGEHVLICVSRLAPEKGFDFLASAAARLAAEGLRFKLLIVGGNRNPSVEAEIQDHFAAVRNHVVFTGFLSGEALARAYAAADLFLHCSVTETFGLVVLEAMASGVPVIARDRGGPSEVVRHGRSGLLVSPDDMDAFVGCVRSLCGDQDWRRRYAIKSREIALDSTWQKINSRTAWYMAAALQKHNFVTRKRLSNVCRPIWLADLINSVVVRPLNRAQERAQLLFAVAVISVFWVIACIPLIIHGMAVFKAR